MPDHSPAQPEMSGGQRMDAGAADWAPTASLEMLRLRARLLAGIRRFFAERGVLEVETPLLCAGTALDVHLNSFTLSPGTGSELYLQTSPEFAMKRLLAAGSGPIFQIGKAFREGEAGKWHNPEFTLLEWYRPGFDHHRLMDEVDELVRELLGTPPATRISYAEAFAETAGLQPHAADQAELIRAAGEQGLPADALGGMERDALLDFLFSHAVQPGLAGRGAIFVHDFPASQAALARVRPEEPPLAERFELLVNGVELANGYHELADPREQRRRFEDARARRCAQGLACYPPDERLLAAMEHGLPDCAGVAVGLDRLVMLAGGAGRIRDVIAFPISRA